MQTNKMFTIAALCMALASCMKSTSVCGAGESVQANGSSFCVYKEAIVIVGGFDCPASMSFRMDFSRATVCSDHGFGDIDVPNDICARAFVPCTPIEDSDAGVAPLMCGGQLCDPPHASAVCLREFCTIETCDVGFGDCNADPADGCEASLNTLTNCGGCDVVCLDACCDQGTCGSCVECIPTSRTDDICDLRDNDCDAFIDEDCSVTVDGGGVCDVGFGDCDGQSANGCEASLNTVFNCGQCGRLCSSANGAASCVDGNCVVAECDAGFGDCDADPANGCETSLNTLTNCGACSLACVGASMTCVTGTCQVASL